MITREHSNPFCSPTFDQGDDVKASPISCLSMEAAAGGVEVTVGVEGLEGEAGLLCSPLM